MDPLQGIVLRRRHEGLARNIVLRGGHRQVDVIVVDGCTPIEPAYVLSFLLNLDAAADVVVSICGCNIVVRICLAGEGAAGEIEAESRGLCFATLVDAVQDEFVAPTIRLTG